jgi:hypothetical protein
MFIKELKKDLYFKLVNKNGKLSKSVYILNHYERSIKKYSISPVDDMNAEKFVKPTQEVSLEFEY